MIKIVSYFNVLYPFFYHWCLFIFTRHSIRVTTYFQTICYCCWSFQNSSDQTDTFVHVCLLLMFDIYHSPVSVWDELLGPLNYLPVTAWCFPETAQTRLMCLFTCVCVLDVRSVTSWDDSGDSHTCRGMRTASARTPEQRNEREEWRKTQLSCSRWCWSRKEHAYLPSYPSLFSHLLILQLWWQGGAFQSAGRGRSVLHLGRVVLLPQPVGGLLQNSQHRRWESDLPQRPSRVPSPAFPAGT